MGLLKRDFIVIGGLDVPYLSLQNPFTLRPTKTYKEHQSMQKKAQTYDTPMLAMIKALNAHAGEK